MLSRYKCCHIVIKILLCSACLFGATAYANDTLKQFSDATLQKNLQAKLQQNKQLRKLMQKQKVQACLVDMSGDVPRFANINGDKMVYAASLPKIAILLAAYESFEDGSLTETPKLRKDLAAMIRVSSNSAATRMIDIIGFDKIQSVLQHPKYGFYDKANGGGLWVGKRFAAKGPRRGDPLFNISHGATANQVCRFFYMLASGKLINSERSAQMLADLGEPELHHKFVSQTNTVAPRAAVHRKSGSWRQYHADAILVRGMKWRNYILVGLVQDSRGEQIIRNLLPLAESVISPSTK